MTHIRVGKLTNIGSDNGLAPSRRQTIIWTNVGKLLIGPLRTNFSEFFIQEKALENVVCEMASILSRPQCVNVLAVSYKCILFMFHCCTLVEIKRITNDIPLYVFRKSKMIYSIDVHFNTQNMVNICVYVVCVHTHTSTWSLSILLSHIYIHKLDIHEYTCTHVCIRISIFIWVTFVMLTKV